MRTSKVKPKRNLALPGEPMTQEEFLGIIKEAEKGQFHALGSFDEFKSDIISAWKKKYGK